MSLLVGWFPLRWKTVDPDCCLHVDLSYWTCPWKFISIPASWWGKAMENLHGDTWKWYTLFLTTFWCLRLSLMIKFNYKERWEMQSMSPGAKEHGFGEQIAHLFQNKWILFYCLNSSVCFSFSVGIPQLLFIPATVHQQRSLSPKEGISGESSVKARLEWKGTWAHLCMVWS